ncbi:MAG: hypothetical protein LBH59_05525, partial [Planctomycetaceae bacterium]|nr:hypothetical protein [Planctomycetaceae bacterium]
KKHIDATLQKSNVVANVDNKFCQNYVIPKPVWAVGFALEQTLRDATLTVFSYVDFKVASAYYYKSICLMR